MNRIASAGFGCLLLMLMATVGCQQQTSAPAPETTPKASPKATPPAAPPKQAAAPSQPAPSTGGGSSGSWGNTSAAMKVRRGADRQTAKGHFENIKIYYHMYANENGRSPAKLEDFLAYIQRDYPAVHKALKEGRYVLRMNALLSSNVVLAYEKDAYEDGSRLVMKGDGSMSVMSEADFQSAVRGK